MATKKKIIEEIQNAKSMEELVEIGHAIEKKDKEIDRAIRDKMNSLLAELL
jgi:hypothetical protein